MEWTPLLKTLVLCFISVLIEAVSATKEGRMWFESLKRPKYSFGLKVWYVVGAVYYIIFGYIAYRQFVHAPTIFTAPIILLTLVMIMNGLGNFLLFKYRSLKWFYFVIYPFGLVLLGLVVVLAVDDVFSALLASLYLLWLVYDVYYGYWMWKLNEK